MTESLRDEGRARETALLRHTLATMAYRAEKVLRDPPEGLATHRIGERSRTAGEILGHLGDLMTWAVEMTEGRWTWRAAGTGDWNADVDRFFDQVARLDAALAAGAPEAHPAGVIFQGPIADALTHVGQIAMLRGQLGAPVRPESFAKARIEIGRVGRDQAAERREFDGDASARR